MAQPTFLVGPAGSGKTTRLLDRYRVTLRSAPIGGVLWLTPTARAGRELRQQLLNAELPACLRPGIHTFTQFADAILEHAGIPIRPISNWQKRELLEELVQAAAARKRGGLKHFGGIADKPGFLDQLTGFVSELKRLEIWPDEFETACQQRGYSDKDRELVTLYRDYQELLVKFQLYDVEGRFWEARELIRNGHVRPFERLELIVVDGFTDFTRTQHEMLQLLAARTPELWISLPLEPDTERPDLFGKTTRTLRELRQRHPGSKLEWVDRPAKPAWPGLAHIERHLFSDPRHAQPLSDGTGLHLVAAARQDGEIEVIGRRIKKLLLGGPQQPPVRPGDIVVVFRSLTEQGPLVREIFTRLGLPFALESARNLTAAPSLCALQGLLQLLVEDWPFRQVLSVLSNSLLQWSPLPADSRDALLAQAQLLVRRLQIHRGAVPLLERAAAVAQAMPTDESDVDDVAPAELNPLPVLEHLHATLNALPQQATPAEWEAALKALARQFGLWTDAPAANGTGPDPAWNAFWDALRETEQLSQLLQRSPPQWNRQAVLDQMDQLLKYTSLPESSDETGCVRVLSAQSARHLHVPYLFAAGLSEKSFPPSDRDDRLYGDAEYQQLNAQGLTLVDRAQRSQEEMLLFYGMLTRATRQLTLSYPALDEKAQPLCASPYLSEVERVCGAQGLRREDCPDLTPTVHVADLLCGDDWRLAAVHLSRAKETPQQERGAALLAGLWKTQAADNLCAGLQQIQSRATVTGFGPYEGLLTSDFVQAQLTRRFGPGHCWSVSQLEEYAYCPHKFYLHRVLNIRPLPELSLELDYFARGGLLHAVLAELHRKWNEQHGGPCGIEPPSVAELLLRFNELVDHCARDLTKEGGVAVALDEINRRVVRDFGPQYLAQAVKYQQAADPAALQPVMQPAFFEVAFGPDKSTDTADPISTDDPFELRHGDEQIKLAGRIDRIDLGQIGAHKVFSVIDYKSGGANKLDEDAVTKGRSLQLPLYALVAEQFLLAAEQATPWQIGHWFFKDKPGFTAKPLKAQKLENGQLLPTEEWERIKQKLSDKVVTIVRGIRAAEFPVACDEEDCTSRCDYKTVCRIHQIRALRKTWPLELPPNPS